MNKKREVGQIVEIPCRWNHLEENRPVFDDTTTVRLMHLCQIGRVVECFCIKETSHISKNLPGCINLCTIPVADRSDLHSKVSWKSLNNQFLCSLVEKPSQAWQNISFPTSLFALSLVIRRCIVWKDQRSKFFYLDSYRHRPFHNTPWPRCMIILTWKSYTTRTNVKSSISVLAQLARGEAASKRNDWLRTCDHWITRGTLPKPLHHKPLPKSHWEMRQQAEHFEIPKQYISIQSRLQHFHNENFHR